MKEVKIKFSFRIPLSAKDIKELWKEHTDANFRFRKKRYYQLKYEVLNEATRWSNVDKDYIISHFDEWVGRYFDKYAQDVLLGSNNKNK